MTKLIKSLSILTLVCIALLAQAFSQTPAFTPFKGGTVVDEINGKASIHTFSNGQFAWQLDGSVLVQGTYDVRGKYLIFTDLSGPRACLDSYEGEGGEVGIYQWETYEDKQYLLVTDDDCSGRQRGFLRLSINTSNVAKDVEAIMSNASPINVSINDKAQITVFGLEVELDDFGAYMKSIAQKSDKSTPVSLQAHSDSEHATVVGLMELIKKAGFNKVMVKVN
jgi:biopolymer transport protein ExbD